MITFAAGALIRGQIREFLERMKFEEEIQSFYETRHLFQSEFLIKGASATAVRRIRYWMQQLDQE
jgi:hypothetical protein